jgi:DNA-directed RNA polymerase III subunit RPC8
MFQLVRRSDTMPIKPFDFNRDLKQVLIELINEKYANHVIADVGLVISLYDIDIIGDGHLVPDNGCAYTEVTFRLIVFRPFTGETLYGSLLRQTPESIQISLGFLQDVTVPASLLQQPSLWDPERAMWYWLSEDDKDSQEKFYMEIGKGLAFKVHKIQYATVKDSGMQQILNVHETREKDASHGSVDNSIVGVAPRMRARSISVDITESGLGPPPVMAIVGRINETGLGMNSWWVASDQVDL